MWVLDRVSRKDALRSVFTDIKRHAVDVMNKPERYVFYSYEMLAALEGGDPDDWRHDGPVRSLMSGHEFRVWFIREYQLFWKADAENHAGLLFTCNPLTGYLWYHKYKHDVTTGVCDFMEEVGAECAKMAPSLGQYFTTCSEAWGDLSTRARKTIGNGHMRLAAPYAGPDPAA